jgi:hypothetical protein
MRKIEHIGIAVNNLETSNLLFEKLFGNPPYKQEEVESEGVKTSFFMNGPNKIELLEATNPESPIAKFLEKNGYNGLGKEGTTPSSAAKTASNVIPTTTNTLQSIIGDTSKINWAIIGNAKNVEDYNKFIDDAIATNDYMKISRRGFEEYGIPNFRTYLADLDLKAGDKSPARESGTPEQLYKINREIFDLYQFYKMQVDVLWIFVESHRYCL